MEMTLDEYLEEIDRWKQAVSDRMLALTAEERAEEYRKAQAWLEANINRPLEHASSTKVKGSAPAATPAG